MVKKTKWWSSVWRSTIKEILLCTVFGGVLIFTIAELITWVMNTIWWIWWNWYQIGVWLWWLIIWWALVFLCKALRKWLENRESISISENINPKLLNKEIWWNLPNWRTLKSILSCKWRLWRVELFFYRWIWLISFFIFAIILFFLLWWENINQILREILVVVLGILTVIRDLIICAWRFHDLWKSWWLTLLLLIPILNLFLGARLLFWKGNKWDNKYWSEPNMVSKSIKVSTIVIRIILIMVFVLIEMLSKIADQL